MSATWYANYELLRKLAAGGMGEVHLARQWGQSGFYRELVVKRLFPHLANNEASLLMFQYEARVMAELQHPNIPQIYDLGAADGTWYIAMEYVPGVNVADLWRASARGGHPMSLEVTLGVMIQVCEALHHAHEAEDRGGHALGIVHRDVTPHNIMITRDGVVKLMDFGVAQTNANPNEERGVVRGTISYMAPEQVRGRWLDRRADVFSLGVVLYELTTGTRLFRGSEMALMTTIVEEDVAPPSSIVPDYPPDLEQIVMATLRRHRDHRIASASDLSAHLEYFGMRNGMMLGPRQVAAHVKSVIQAEKVLQPELALVQEHQAAAAAARQAEVHAPMTQSVESAAYALPLSQPKSSAQAVAVVDAAIDFDDDDAEILDDVELLELDELEPLEESGALTGRDTIDEGGAKRPSGVSPSPTAPTDGPVVALDAKKAVAEELDYISELGRKLES